MSGGREIAIRAALRRDADDLLRFHERRAPCPEDAADLLGETLLQAWRRVDDLPDDAERQRMWLFGIAVHVLANHRRSTRRRLALVDRLRSHLRPVEAPDPADGNAVRDAVLRLPADQRDLVTLVHWEGFSLVDAAEVLGVNPSTARSRYAAARTALRATLGAPAGQKVRPVSSS